MDRVDYLVLAAVERDASTVAGYDIARAIRSVAAGEALIDGAVAGRVLAALPTTPPPRPEPAPPFPRLTSREREILILVARRR